MYHVLQDVPGSEGMAHAWARVSPGSHNLRHEDPRVTFMALVSGTYKVNSYAYLAGLRLATINAVSTKTRTRQDILFQKTPMGVHEILQTITCLHARE